MSYIDRMVTVEVISEKFNLPICEVYNALIKVPSITDAEEPTIWALKRMLDKVWALLTDDQKISVLLGDNTCVVCGAVIPEGRWICPNCESEVKT